MIELRQVGPRDWELLSPITINGVTIPAGFETDMASVPRPVSWLLPRVSSWNPAAAGHDYLWRDVCPTGAMTYREADYWLRDSLRTLDVAFWRRNVVWAGVRLGAATKGRAHLLDTLRDLPAILAVLVVVGWIVLGVSLHVLKGLVLFWAVERVTWLVGWRLRRCKGGKPSLLVRQ